MPTRFESVRRIGRKIGINEDRAFALAILLVLIVVFSVVAGYYLVFKPQAEPYSTIYLLDSQNTASNYPEVLVANQNSTCTVDVAVVNHMGEAANFQVRMKITQDLSTSPVDAQPSQVWDINSLENGKSWQTTATITQNEPGSYSVVFELWQRTAPETFEFTHNDCILNIQVVI